MTLPAARQCGMEGGRGAVKCHKAACIHGRRHCISCGDTPTNPRNVLPNIPASHTLCSGSQGSRLNPEPDAANALRPHGKGDITAESRLFAEEMTLFPCDSAMLFQ